MTTIMFKTLTSLWWLKVIEWRHVRTFSFTSYLPYILMCFDGVSFHEIEYYRDILNYF